MRRRDFIGLLGGAAATWPLAVKAQSAMPVVGFLSASSASGSIPWTAAFLKGLSETGHVPDRNLLIEYRWAEGQYEKLPMLAADLVRRRVTVIAAVGGPPQALAAMTATKTIPVVFQIGADPVQLGLVISLSRPGGNVTGVSSLNLEVGPKRLEAMHELVPGGTVISLLVNPSNPVNAEAEARDLQAAALTLGRQLRVLQASTDHDIERVLSTLSQERPAGLVIGPDSFLQSRTAQLAALTVQHAIPTITPYREFAVAGGLMSYGGDVSESWHAAGIYVGRILKGEKPVDLPVQQVTRVELIINMKTAKALGVTFPTALLVRADEVIE
jgi:putative ABC transport system substrate-binding protein